MTFEEGDLLIGEGGTSDVHLRAEHQLGYLTTERPYRQK